jgi:hypothetical protein
VDYLALFAGTMSLWQGLRRVIAPRRSHSLELQNRNMRLAEIEAGASESFFEEYRSLKAYPVTPSHRVWQMAGWLWVLAGLLFLAMGFVGKEAFPALFD